MSENDKASPPQQDNKYQAVNNVTKEAFVVDWDQMTLIASILGAVCIVVAIAWAKASFNINRNEKMAEAIKNGSHPMDAYCAFNGSSENKVCLVRAAVSGKEIK